ncbi:uncharacterized protein METZ01_LOCUS310777 [marine metagenome]|uniref:Uncharacterized protein n=1 Tax=marine metagenome TaxID=408172 RepID=A0A382N9Q0_9ZZZZ
MNSATASPGSSSTNNKYLDNKGFMSTDQS